MLGLVSRVQCGDTPGFYQWTQGWFPMSSSPAIGAEVFEISDGLGPASKRFWKLLGGSIETAQGCADLAWLWGQVQTQTCIQLDSKSVNLQDTLSPGQKELSRPKGQEACPIPQCPVPICPISLCSTLLC